MPFGELEDEIHYIYML